MAYLLTPEHVAWSHWVSGEATSATRFYGMVGNHGYTPASNPRWRQLAAVLTNPNYRMNYDYVKSRTAQGFFPKSTLQPSQLLEDRMSFNEQLGSVMSRANSQAAPQRARRTRSGWFSLTGGKSAKCVVHTKSQSVVSLPRLAPKGHRRTGSMTPTNH